jgi:hypothetical protein
MNFENTFNLPPGVSPIRMVQLPQPSTLCRPTLVRPPTPVGPLNPVRPSTPLGPPTPVRPPTPFRPPTPVRPPTPMRQPTPQPNRPILLLQRSQHPSSLLPLDQLIHPTPTQPSTSMKRSNSPHQVLLQPSVGATSSSPPSPHSTVLQTSLMTMPSSSPSSHSTVVQPPMTTIPSGSSSPHSTVSTAEQPSSRHSPSSTSGTSAKVARGRGGRTKRTAQKNGNSDVSKRSYQPLTKAYTWAGKYFVFTEWSQKYVYLSDVPPTVTEVIPLQEDPLAITQLC